MKRAAVFAMSFACLAGAASAEWLEEGQQTVRLDYIYGEDVGSENADGVEIAFGTALYDLDDVAVYFTHSENSDMEAQQLGLSVQEHFPIPYFPLPLIPYAGAAAGYGWLDVDGPDRVGEDPDKGGWIARVEAGAILKLCDYFALHAGARLNFSTHDIYLEDDGGVEDTAWDFAFGARFYY